MVRRLASVALEELSCFPLDVKRAEVYPAVIDVAVTYWCEHEGPSNCGYELEAIVEFFLRELEQAEDLAAQVFAAMKGRKPRFRVHPHFFKLVRAAREPTALPLIAGLHDQFYWGEAVIALWGESLADDLLAGVAARADYNDIGLSMATGLLCGERGREALLEQFHGEGFRKDGYAVGVAFAGKAEDAALFKALSARALGATAKRIYAALTRPKAKDRLKALDALAKKTSEPALLLACELLTDDEPQVVARCARLLSDYVADRGEYQSDVYHGRFLAQARAAVATGADAEVISLLEAVAASIPRVQPLGGESATEVKASEKKASEEKASKEKASKEKATKKKATKKKAPKKKAPKKASKAASVAAAVAWQGGADAPGRNAELEAAMVADPDDPTPALVYGDWLQGQGDPRGALIALSFAAEQGDAAAGEAAEALLAKARDVLVGETLGQRSVELSFARGFIRSARLSFARDDKLREALDALLAHPSACVLRELTVESARADREVDPEQVVSALLAAGGPPTLRRLTVGMPGTWPLPDTLLAAFPGLRADDAAAWAEAMAAADKHGRKLKVSFAAGELPPLQPRDAVELEVDAEQVLRGLRVELDKGKAIGVVEALRQVFTAASLDAFALALLEQWLARGERSADKWAFTACGSIGGDGCARRIGALLADWSHQRATQGVELLARIGTDQALHEVIALALTPTRTTKRREAAQQALLAEARRRDVSADALLVRACPRTLATEASQLARAREVQRRWLFNVMLSGQRIGGDDFSAYVARHPLRAPLASGLVWGRYRDDKLEALLRLQEGAGVGADGAAVPFEAEQNLGVPHPAELEPAQLEAWRGALRAAGIEQPFDQIERPVMKLEADERDVMQLRRFAKRRVGFHRIRDGLESFDWVVHNKDHGIESLARRFARGGVALSWRSGGRGGGVGSRSAVQVVAEIGANTGTITEVWAQRGERGAPLRLGELHEVVTSEVLYDVERTVGPARGARRSPPPRPAERPAAAAAGDVLPQSGRYPLAEHAKSGRSKCVVCGEKIEKGSVRVGVERLIETPNFSGRATAWLHPGCRDRCPELTAMDDPDAALAKNAPEVWPPSD